MTPPDTKPERTSLVPKLLLALLPIAVIVGYAQLGVWAFEAAFYILERWGAVIWAAILLLGAIGVLIQTVRAFRKGLRGDDESG